MKCSSSLRQNFEIVRDRGTRADAMPTALPESCWVLTDERHHIKSASDSWCMLWGFTEKEAIGKPVSIINRPGFSSPISRRRYALEKSSHTRCTNVTKYGELISHDLTLEPRPDGILGTSTNIERCISSTPPPHRASRHGGRNAEYFGEEGEAEEGVMTQDTVTIRLPSGRDAEYFEAPGSSFLDLPSKRFGSLPPGFQPDRRGRSVDRLARKPTPWSDEPAPWSNAMKVPKPRWSDSSRGRNSEYFDDTGYFADGTLICEITAASKDEITPQLMQRGRNSEYFEESLFGGGPVRNVRMSGRDGEFDDISLHSSPIFPSFFSRTTRVKSGRDGEFDSQDVHPMSSRAKSARDSEFDGCVTIPLPPPLAPPVLRVKSGRDAEF